MHLSLHKKAFNKVLLISNGYETFYNDIKGIANKLYFIDPYYQKENYLESLEVFQNYLKKNNIKDHSLKIIYGSGLENKCDIKEYLDNDFDICGNSLHKSTLLSNPYNLDKKLFNDNVVLPEISHKFHYKYLSKKNNSSGGLNVGNNFSSSDIYYQKYIPGKTYSVSFVSNGTNTQILGFNQLFHVKNNSEYPYMHAGAMTLCLNDDQLEKYRRWIFNFASIYKLNGFCSIDYKLHNNKIYILDINPRLSGTYRLYKKKYKKLMENHIGLTSEKIELYSNNYHAYIILYAKNDLVFNESINDIKDISDTPTIGESFKKNMPILTLNIRSHDKYELMSKIKNRIKSAMKIIDCYNIDLEYE